MTPDTKNKGASQMHMDELAIDVTLVENLVKDQFPHWAGAPFQPLGDTGSSNKLYKLGDKHIVRLPRQKGGGASVLKEALWCEKLANQLPMSICSRSGDLASQILRGLRAVFMKSLS